MGFAVRLGGWVGNSIPAASEAAAIAAFRGQYGNRPFTVTKRTDLPPNPAGYFWYEFSYEEAEEPAVPAGRIIGPPPPSPPPGTTTGTPAPAATDFRALLSNPWLIVAGAGLLLVVMERD